MANRKITVIGAGAVGATTAFALTLKNIASEIVLVDINESKALGEAMDIRQSTPLLSDPVNVYASDYEAAANSDIVVITSGMPRKPGQTRIDLAQTNVNILKQIAPQITKSCPNATYVIVSNPVDILTYVFHKVTDIPSNKIIGTGTLLDTARLRARVADYLAVSQKNVHAYVFGEHGETSFVPWSIAEASTISLFDTKDRIKLDDGILVDLDYKEIERHVRSSGAKVIERKGCTNYAISVAVCSICEAIFGAVNAIQTVSIMMNGDYGISDVCLSVPALIGNGVVRGRITPVLTDEEVAKLKFSADSLKKVIAQLDI